eukprot:764764-Pyramimonas_sp.AAC.1
MSYRTWNPERTPSYYAGSRDVSCTRWRKWRMSAGVSRRDREEDEEGGGLGGTAAAEGVEGAGGAGEGGGGERSGATTTKKDSDTE